MQIVFLGTSCMVPTKERNVSSVYLNYKGEGILFDCGEGTQRQMNITGLKRTSVKKILVTHWHGDHVSGIIGLIQTIGNKEEKPTLEIFGPKGSKKRVNALLESVDFDNNVIINVHELESKKVKSCFENEDYNINYVNTQHNTPSIGFSFVEKDKLKVNMAKLKKIGVGEGPHIQKLKDGKNIVINGEKINFKDYTSIVEGRKVTYTGDTLLCNELVELAKDSDVLISESCYSHKIVNKAEEFCHMTARWAAELANSANVKKLYLTHFSQRYKEVHELEEEARTYFDEVIAAEDFMKINL